MNDQAPQGVSLTRIVTDVVKESDSNDPRAIAEQAAARIPHRQLKEALAEALVAQVRQIMREDRNRAMDAVMRPPSSRSAKVSGIRDWWAQFLASRVCVGDTAWKAMGDCTDDDLAYAETSRRADAERELARADLYLKLRKLLRDHGVRTIAELPPEAVGEVNA